MLATATTGLQAEDQPSTSDMFNTGEKKFRHIHVLWMNGEGGEHESYKE